MSGKSKAPEPVLGLNVEGLSGLSGNATRFVRQHPRQARVAVAAALEAAAVQYEADEAAAESTEVPATLRPFIVDGPLESSWIGAAEAAKRLRISRTTVYDWVERKKLIGWRSTKQGTIIPAEQILGPGKVVKGIAEVLQLIEDPELAWDFLSREWPFADERVRPIDKLKAGNIEEVLNAAPSFGSTFT